MYPFYEAGEKKTQKDKAVRDFLYINGEHQWRDVSPPPPSPPQDRAELGDRIQAQPHGRKTKKKTIIPTRFCLQSPVTPNVYRFL